VSARPSTASLIAAGLLDFARVNEGAPRTSAPDRRPRRTRRSLRERWGRSR